MSKQNAEVCCGFLSKVTNYFKVKSLSESIGVPATKPTSILANTQRKVLFSCVQHLKKHTIKARNSIGKS